MASTTQVGRRLLGKQGLEVSALGLGCMGMSAFYGAPKPDADMIQLIHQALDLGITFFDTSDIYGPHTNEILLGKAFKGIRDKVEIATKFSISFEGGGVSIRGDEDYVLKACDSSLQRLGVDYVDLYYQHRVDTGVPIEITVGAMKKLVEQGKVKYLGLSEASADTIRRAHAVHPITALQLEWSLWTRDIEKEIVPLCRELGIGLVPYSPLGRGFFSGKAVTEALDPSDWRNHLPRFQNADRNKILYDRVSVFASKKGYSPGQLALAWVLGQGEDVVPIPGTTKLANLRENIGALAVKLSEEEKAEVASFVPEDEVAGERYREELSRTTWVHANTPKLE
eukprot:TRINITY_DN618_c0_g1_i2.p1 TRINITY_DN618_c0_g1~~TRINITY_DN618_c0_g1_i2.p1  ORF type:complete len:339 (-),score=61.89 TRINITY_DN618_c0_g1_i2:167-1183(-)